MKRERYILLLFGLFAISTAILGYGGLFEKLAGSSHKDLELECYKIIDWAQLWYSRPASSGGGGRSFRNLDFKKIGISNDNNLKYTSENGTFEFRNIKPHQFDLKAVSKDGATFEAVDLAYDTRPRLIRR